MEASAPASMTERASAPETSRPPRLSFATLSGVLRRWWPGGTGWVAGGPPPPASGPPVDLLESLRRSRILTGPHLEQVRSRVRSGLYPSDSIPLARQLIRDGVLTDFQARCLLRGRPDRLSFGVYILLDSL